MAPPSTSSNVPELVGTINVYAPTSINPNFQIVITPTKTGITPMDVLGLTVSGFQDDVCKFCEHFQKVDSTELFDRPRQKY